MTHGRKPEYMEKTQEHAVAFLHTERPRKGPSFCEEKAPIHQSYVSISMELILFGIKFIWNSVWAFGFHFYHLESVSITAKKHRMSCWAGMCEQSNRDLDSSADPAIDCLQVCREAWQLFFCKLSSLSNPTFPALIMLLFSHSEWMFTSVLATAVFGPLRWELGGLWHISPKHQRAHQANEAGKRWSSRRRRLSVPTKDQETCSSGPCLP